MASAGVQSHRVLLVDDDELVLAVLHTALVQYGYAVRDATDLSSALRLLRIQPVDVVILDGRMDGSTLEEGLAVLRAIPGKFGVIVLSGSTVDLALLERYSATYLAKPVDAPVFLERVAASVPTS
jgi:two-component system torCAD operon response regulator TorR